MLAEEGRKGIAPAPEALKFFATVALPPSPLLAAEDAGFSGLLVLLLEDERDTATAVPSEAFFCSTSATVKEAGAAASLAVFVVEFSDVVEEDGAEEDAEKEVEGVEGGLIGAVMFFVVDSTTAAAT